MNGFSTTNSLCNRKCWSAKTTMARLPQLGLQEDQTRNSSILFMIYIIAMSKISRAYSGSWILTRSRKAKMLSSDGWSMEFFLAVCGSVTCWVVADPDRRSMPLTNGSGSGSCYFRQDAKQKIIFLRFSACYFLKLHLHHFSKKWKVPKKSQNCRNRGFSYLFCLMIDVSGSVPLLTIRIIIFSSSFLCREGFLVLPCNN
jgi:hypothetical protein